jgi:rare lipoprotein A
VAKRRPSWFDRCWQAAVVGSLLLSHGLPVGAAGDEKIPPSPPPPPFSSLPPLSLKESGEYRQTAPPAAFGIADALDADLPGLRGLASFYSFGFVGRRTASGERFDPHRFVAASNHFPLGSLVAVLRPDNGRCAVVRINDRMHKKHRRRIIDVTYGVAKYLGMLRAGVVPIQLAGLPAGAAADESDCRMAFAIEPICADCAAGVAAAVDGLSGEKTGDALADRLGQSRVEAVESLGGK